MLTPHVRDKLLSANLTAAQWRIWCYLVSLDPFGDRGAKFLPAELMLKCGVKRATYFAAKAKFQKLGLFDFRDGVTKVFNLQGHSNSTAHSQQQKPIESKTSDYSQQTQLVESKSSDSQSKISDSQSKISDSQSKISDSESAKPLKNGASDSPQTIQTLQTNQTGAGEQVKSHLRQQRRSLKAKVKSEVEASVKSQDSSSSTNELSSLSDVLEGATSLKSDKSSAPVTQNTTKNSTPWDIPQDLRNKLEELEIPLDARVLKAIATHRLSQAYGAVAHIENTRETINNPRGVFLFQISRQPIESLGSRGRVMTARDFDGYTVEHLKKMYPNNWREAAVHFGVPLDD